MRTLFIAITLVALVGCTNEPDALRALEAEGFTDVQWTGYDFFACSKDDFYATGFSAVRDGKRHRGTVCAGILFKGSTIRWK